MNGARKGKSCRAEGWLPLLQLLFVEKSEKHGYQLRRIQIGKLLRYGALDAGFVYSVVGRISFYRYITMEVGGFVSCF